MNKITNAERNRIVLWAHARVALNGDWSIRNYDEVVDALMAKFKISKQRAKGYTTKAAMMQRNTLRKARDK